MSFISSLRNLYWVWAVGWELLLTASCRGNPPTADGEKRAGALRSLLAKVVRAWQQARAEVDWLRVEERGGWWFFHPLDEGSRVEGHADFSYFGLACRVIVGFVGA